MKVPISVIIEWIKKQRQCLNSLVKEDSLQKVEDLLQTSLNEIKELTELHVRCCETQLFEIKCNLKDYGFFLKYLGDLQKQLKPLLQGRMVLFHPDHVMNLTRSQAMRVLINDYSQSYLKLAQYSLDKFKNYPLRIKEFNLDTPISYKIKYSLKKLISNTYDVMASFILRRINLNKVDKNGDTALHQIL